MSRSKLSASFPGKLLVMMTSKVGKKISLVVLMGCMVCLSWWSDQLLQLCDIDYRQTTLYRNLGGRRQLLLEPMIEIIDEEDIDKIEEWSLRELQAERPTVNPVLESSTQYKFLSFGTSITWGAAMSNRFDAYPFILGGRDADNSNITNLAQRASGPGFPSICLESILPHNKPQYDVILLEYYMTGGFGLPILARRLRRIYPDALIVVVQIWYPILVKVAWTDGHNYDLRTWAARIHNIKSLDDRRLINAMKAAPPGTFYYVPDEFPQHATQVTLDLVDGILYSLPKPEDPIQAIEQYQSLFSKRDWHHLSEHGHAFIAQEIYNLVQSHKDTQKETEENVPVEPSRFLQEDVTTFPSDACYDWFQTGDCPLKYDDDLHMELIVNRTDVIKFGLDFPVDSGGSFYVTNPNPTEEMELYLRYMITGPAPSDYPKFSVAINGVITQQEVDIHEYLPFPHKVHVAVASHVGTVKPGENVITVTPVEKDKKYPFRLVSVAMVKKEVIEWDDEATLPINMENFMRTLYSKSNIPKD